MSMGLIDGKMDFVAKLTRSEEEHFDWYTSIRLESESANGSNISLSLTPDEAVELYLKTVRVTVEVMD